MSDASELMNVHTALLEWTGDPDIGEMAAADAQDLRQCVMVMSANEVRNERLYEIYEGTVPLAKVPTIVPDRYKDLRIGCPWPEVAVQSVVERSRVSGFVFGPDADGEEEAMREISERCDLALGYQAALTDSLISGVSFAVVGRDELGACVRWHTSRSAAGVWDYANNRLACGFAIVDRARRRAVTGDEASDTVPSKVDFYTPRGCWEITRGGSTRAWSASWLPDVMGEPRIVALVFRPDGEHPLGRSRFSEPMRACVQEYMANALNLHVASEFTALGQKWATGLSDEQYDALASAKWKFSADAAVLATENPNTNAAPQFGNFTQQSMEPILSVKRSLRAAHAGQQPDERRGAHRRQGQAHRARRVGQRPQLAHAAQDRPHAHGRGVRLRHRRPDGGAEVRDGPHAQAGDHERGGGVRRHPEEVLGLPVPRDLRRRHRGGGLHRGAAGAPEVRARPLGVIAARGAGRSGVRPRPLRDVRRIPVRR